jgi:hypothetical protein
MHKSNYIKKLKEGSNGKGDRPRITNFQSYWESDYFKHLEDRKLKKEVKDEK